MLRNEWRDVPGSAMRVHRFEVIGTALWVHQAWEPVDPTAGLGGSHSTTTTDDRGDRLGQLGTRRPTPELDALPAYSDERAAAFQASWAAQHAAAVAAIALAFTDIADLGSRGGTIHVRDGEVTVHVPGSSPCYRHTGEHLKAACPG